MDLLAVRLSEAWAAGVVDAATAGLLLQAFPGVRLVSIAVQGPSGLMTMFSNFARPGALQLTLQHPCNSAAGHVMRVGCPVRFELLDPSSDSSLPDLQQAGQEHGCQYCDCIPVLNPPLSLVALTGCLTLGFPGVPGGVNQHEDRALARAALLAQHLGQFLPHKARPVIERVHTYMLPLGALQGEGASCICGDDAEAFGPSCANPISGMASLPAAALPSDDHLVDMMDQGSQGRPSCSSLNSLRDTSLGCASASDFSRRASPSRATCSTSCERDASATSASAAVHTSQPAREHQQSSSTSDQPSAQGPAALMQGSSAFGPSRRPSSTQRSRRVVSPFAADPKSAGPKHHPLPAVPEPAVEPVGEEARRTSDAASNPGTPAGKELHNRGISLPESRAGGMSRGWLTCAVGSRETGREPLSGALSCPFPYASPAAASRVPAAPESPLTPALGSKQVDHESALGHSHSTGRELGCSDGAEDAKQAVLDVSRHTFLMTFKDDQLEACYARWHAGQHLKMDICATVLVLVLLALLDVVYQLSRATSSLYLVAFPLVSTPLILMLVATPWYLVHREPVLTSLCVSLVALTAQILGPALLQTLAGKSQAPLALHIIDLSRVTATECLAAVPMLLMVRFRTFLRMQPVAWAVALSGLLPGLTLLNGGKQPGWLVMAAAGVLQGAVGFAIPTIVLRVAEGSSRSIFASQAR